MLMRLTEEAALATSLRQGDWDGARRHTLILRDRLRQVTDPKRAAQGWAALAHGLVAIDPDGAENVAREAARRSVDLPALTQELGDLLALVGTETPPPNGSLLGTIAAIVAASETSLSAAISEAVRALHRAEPDEQILGQRWLEIALTRQGIVAAETGGSDAVLFDTISATVGVGGSPPKPFARSRRRFELLFTLATEPSLTREQLFERVWGQRWNGEASKNALHATISRTRTATDLEIVANPQGGYRLEGSWSVFRKGPARRSLAETSGFIGRDTESHALRQGLQDQDVVCAWGPPGAGKSRLVAEFARSWGGRVLQVDLRGVTELAEVQRRIGRRLGCAPEDLVRALLRDPQTLLVLDDLDQLEHTAAEALAARLLKWTGSGRLVVVATRREALPSVHDLRIDPLPPHDAVQLLQIFAPDAETAELEILAARLDHLPLALELAGAHLQRVPTSVLIEQIPEVLGSGPVTEAMALSWSSLPTPLRDALGRLAVLTTAIPLDAAEGLVGPERLAALVRRGLVQPAHDHVSLLSSVQHFVRAHLESQTREAVLDALLDWADAVPMERFSADLEAVLEVQSRGVAQFPERASRLALTLAWRLQGFAAPDDVLAMVARAIDVLGATPTLQLAEATARFSATQFEEGSALIPEIDALPEGLLRETAVLLGAKLARVRRADDARARLDRAVDLCTGDRLREALNIRAFFLLSSEVEAATADLERAVEVATTLGPVALGRARANLGLPHAVQGRLSEAERAFSEGVDTLTELGVIRVLRHILHNLGLIRQRLGNLDGATAAAEQALQLHEELGQSVRAASTRMGLAGIALDRGDLERSIRLAYQVIEEVGESERQAHVREEAIATAAAGHLHLQQPEAARAVLANTTGFMAALIGAWLDLRAGHAARALTQAEAVLDDWRITGMSHFSTATVHALCAVFDRAAGGEGTHHLEQARAKLDREDHTEALVVQAAAHHLHGEPPSDAVPQNHFARLILGLD